MRVLLGVDLAADDEARRQVATLLVQFGEELAAEGDSDAAREMFQRALDLDPPSNTPVYVWIEPGEFAMGSSDDEIEQAMKICDEGDFSCVPDWFADETPTHLLELDGYWIMRTEVSNAQYARCVAAGACEAPDNSDWDRADLAQRLRRLLRQ